MLNLTGRVTVDPDGQSLTISFPNRSAFTISPSFLTKVTKLCDLFMFLPRDEITRLHFVRLSVCP